MGWLSKLWKKAKDPMMIVSPSTALGLNLKQVFVDPHKEAKAQEEADRAQAEADRAAALEQEKKTAAETKAYQDALLEQAKNASALQSANDAIVTPEVSNVIAGGTASTASKLRKKRVGGSVSSTLGINV